MAEQPDREIIGAPLSALLAPLQSQLAELCQCIKDHAQQPGMHPCDTFPFTISRSIIQTAVCHTGTTILQVPKAHVGVITRIAFQERYPGSLYGANFMLQINDNLDPNMPRVDVPIGGSLGDGLGTRICLEEQDLVSIVIQCSWTPVEFTAMASTFEQMIYPFQVTGYYQKKRTCDAI
jgi:hypothetical protein